MQCIILLCIPHKFVSIYSNTYKSNLCKFAVTQLAILILELRNMCYTWCIFKNIYRRLTRTSIRVHCTCIKTRFTCSGTYISTSLTVRNQYSIYYIIFPLRYWKFMNSCEFTVNSSTLLDNLYLNGNHWIN